MGSADGIAAHVFQQRELAAQGCLVDGGSQRTQVMVVAYALEFAGLAIEHKALVRHDGHRADAEACGVFVNQLFPFIDLGHGFVERGSLGCPELWMAHQEVLFQVHSLVHPPQMLLACHLFAVRVQDVCYDAHVLSVGSRQGGGQLHRGVFLAHVGGRDMRSPGGHVDFIGHHHSYVSVESRPGIPAGRLRLVFQPHGQRVWLAVFVQAVCHVLVKGVVSIGPLAYFLSVHVYAGFAHGSVKLQCHPFSGGRGERGAIPSHAYVGQSSRPAGLHGGLCLEVLRDGHVLQVVVPAERTIDGPVVRDGHLLPFPVVKVGRHGFGHVALLKLPPFFQGGYASLRP